jgi:hypothetical protein
MKVFIAVIFLINQQVAMHPSFLPLQVESMEDCLKRLPAATEYFEKSSPYPFDVQCHEASSPEELLSKLGFTI